MIFMKQFSNVGRSVHTLAVAATNKFEEYKRYLFKNILTPKIEKKLFLQKVLRKQ